MKKLRAIIVAIMLGLVGASFCACAPDYSKLQIRASYTQDEQGALSLSQGQSEIVVFTVSNMPKGFNFDINLSLSSNKVRAIVEDTNKKDGKITVKVTAISYGDCVLRATTTEGNKFVDVPIKVELAVEDFSLKGETKLFVVKGTNNPKDLLLDNSCFNFSPVETTQKQIIWYDKNDNVITKVSASSFSQSEEKNIKIYAKSPYLDKKLEVDVEIIDEIKSVEIWNLKETQTTNPDGQTATSYEKDGQIAYIDGAQNVLKLVTNKSDFARKYIRLYVTCGKNELLKNQNGFETQNIAMATTIDTILQGEENFVPYFDISLQALREGQTTVNFEVFYEGYSGYKITKTFVLNVVSAPEKIVVNDIDQTEFQTQILYDNINSTVMSNLNVSLVPNTAVFDKVTFEFFMGDLTGNFDDYIALTCAGEKVSQDTILYNLNSPILAKGLKSTQDKEIAIKIKAFWGENQGITHKEEPVEYTIKFEVKTGASALNIEDNFAKDGIFVDIDQTSQIVFDGLYVKELDSWIDKIQIYNVSSQNVASLQQYDLPEEQKYLLDANGQIIGKKVGLLLSPIMVGTGKYNIYLPNGVSRTLVITVVKQPQSVSVDIAENANVTRKNYDANGNLENISMMLSKKDEKFSGIIQFVTVVNGQVQTFAKDNDLFVLETNQTQNQALEYFNDTLTIGENFDGQILDWSVRTKKVENFALIDNEDLAFSGTIELLAYVPIESIEFSQKELNLYSKSELGINYKDEAKSKTELVFNPSIENLDITNISIDWSASVDSVFDSDTKILYVTNYGSYNTVTNEFELDTTGTNPTSFYVYATINYNGQLTVAGFKVNPLKYIQVTGIKLNNYVGPNGIYLSPTKDSVDLFTYVLPSNAIHQELIYKFEPSTGSATNIVKLVNITDSNGLSIGVRVSFANNGGGSGNIVIIAKSTIINQSQTPQSALYIPVHVGDGSYQNPYKITTAQEFLSINQNGLDKHYVIENTIDLSGYTINFDKLTGTIDGKGTGKITGIVINKTKDGYAGLFGQIGTKEVVSDSDKPVLGENNGTIIFGNAVTGQIKNICLEGKINIEVEDKNLVTLDNKRVANIGFVCGELMQGAKLENVSVKLQNSTVILKTSDQVNIGGVVGKNSGEIVSKVDFKQQENQSSSTKLLLPNICLLDMQNFEVKYQNTQAMNQSNPTNFGGIAGLNQGKIQKIFYQRTNLVGDDHFLAKTNMIVSRLVEDNFKICMNVASVAGTNKGEISAYRYSNYTLETNGLDTQNYSDFIKTVGIIKIDAIDDCIVGGLVAENDNGKLQYSLTRTKIWVLSEKALGSKAFVGGIYGKNDNGGTINNCTIQATEDVSAIGINATMIYSKSGLTQTNDIDNNFISVYGYQSDFDQNKFATGVSDLQAITFVGQQIDDGQVTIAGRVLTAPYQNDQLTFMTSDNYYGDMFVGQFDKIGAPYNGQKFSPRKANFVIDAKKNKLTSETGSELAMYVYFKQAKDSKQQSYLDAYNTITLPFEFDGEISITSFDDKIIRVQNNGLLELMGNGLCKLRITCSLNTKIYKDVYVLVTNQFDTFNLYKNSISSSENLIVDGGLVSVMTNQNAPLVAQFSNQNFDINGFDIALEGGNQSTVICLPDQAEEPLFDFEKVGNIYVLKNLGLNGSQTLNFKLCLNVNINGNLYSSLYTDQNDNTKKGYLTFDENNVQKEYQKYFVARSIQGATNIRLDNTHTSLEPVDIFELNLQINTDNFDEKINIYTNKILGEKVDFIKYKENTRRYTIKSSDLLEKLTQNELDKLEKSNENQNVYKFYLAYFVDQNNSNNNKYKEVYINIIDKTLSTNNIDYFSQLNLILSSENYYFAIYDKNNQNTNIEINKLIKLEKIEINYTIYFDCQNLPQDYQGGCFVTFEAESTNISTALQIDLYKQQLSKIVFESFEGANQEDINSGNQQSPYINPGNANHFRISVVPTISDYDYLTITSSSDKFLFALIDQEANTLQGASLIENGLKIPRDLITESIFVKYTVGSLDVANGQVYNFDVTAYKDGSEIYKVSKQITVKFAKDVTLQIQNKQKYDNAYFLTRGSSYDFVLNTYGYSDDEVIIETNRSDLISIDKQNNKISITNSNITYPSATDLGGVNAKITVYGRKTVDGDVVLSNPDEINIAIVEYTINENENTIVDQGSDGVVNVSMGDHYVFDTKLINGINAEYSTSIAELPTTTKRFTDAVTKNAIWEYQLAKKGSNNTYFFDNSIAWTKIEENVTAENTDNNFVLKIVDGKIVFLPLKVNSPESSRYRFRLSYGYEYKGGVAVFQEFNSNETRAYGSRQDIFTANVYQLSSIDTPTPISSEKELMSMQENSYYILTDDIVLSSNFVPIDKQIAGLDGNGKKIILSTNYSASNKTKFGIFETIYQNTLVRNLTIQVQSSIRITLEGSSSINVGLLAGENNGIVSNCYVETMDENNIRMILSGIGSSNVYIGGLVGQNNGYITNSRVKANITSSSNLAGFVCQNNGKISSSCTSDCLLINTSTDTNSKTAGFVCFNSGDKTNTGVIITSYTSGTSLQALNLTIYANDTSKQIKSSTETAGFVFQNEGKITDCYSNIPITTSSKSAGFVFKNTGDIYSSFSTSMLKSLSQESYGFVFDNAEGKVNGCKYLSEPGLVNYSINPSNNSIDGLAALNIKQFADKSNFESFTISDERNVTKGNWFFPLNSTENIFNNKDKQFIPGRLELVSANIITSSIQQLNLDATITDEVTGEVTYVYDNVGEARGSIYNPYIVINAKYFEDYILKSSSNNLNTKYYRLVCDINYESVLYSNLHEIVFAGDIEGNGMLISEYVIDDMKSLVSSGLFAKIGNGVSEQGCVKNLLLKPKFINLPNATCVGGLAGTLDGGTLCNVTISGTNNNSTLVILGKNIVGGLVGRAINDFQIINCSSSISANSTFRSKTVLGEIVEDKNDKIASYFLIKAHSVTSLSKVSYAGCLAGVLAGNGVVNNTSFYGNVASIAEFAGLMFGGIGNGVSVSNIDQSIHSGQFLQAAVYGGLIAGESYGRIQDVNLNVSQDAQNLFRNVPFTAFAVGGIVGLLGDESNLPPLSRENILESGIFDTKVSATLVTGYISTIGGLAGEAIGGKIARSGFEGDVIGLEIAGGLIGSVTSKPSADIKLSKQTLSKGNVANQSIDLVDQCFVKGGGISVSNDNIGQAKVGGFVGFMYIEKNSNGNFVIKNSYSTNQIKVKSDFYGTSCDISAGGLIGKISQMPAYTLGKFFVKFEYCYVDCKIELDIRDLKESTSESDKKDLYNIWYGEIVANNKNGFDIVYTFDPNQTTSNSNRQTSVKFVKYEANSNATGHIINLSYYQDGKMNVYDYKLKYSKQEYKIVPDSTDSLINYYDLLDYSNQNVYTNTKVETKKGDDTIIDHFQITNEELAQLHDGSNGIDIIGKFLDLASAKSRNYYLEKSNVWKEQRQNGEWVLVLAYQTLD